MLRTASDALLPEAAPRKSQGPRRNWCPTQRQSVGFLSRYWKLDPARVYASGPNAWDTAVHDASEEYKHRMHNLCCDNCHSHVALALNLMRYNNSTNWNMVTLCFFCLLYGKYVRGPHYESCGQTLLLAFMPRQVPGPLTEGLSPETGDCGRSQ
ncbi:transmembrane protein 222 isoform X3 [Molossus molossus]|uniref:transmembrane protein 222 isoform X3 n=1 Tax=Molossus molossus TaxID=27622 RepID=UPI0017471133|nr:transmembrane protein 222 isoform X3 [Molossus molossus]